MEALTAFMDAMAASAIVPSLPDEVRAALPAGQVVSFHCIGDRRGTRKGWAILHLDNFPAGAFGHHRQGGSHRWKAGAANPMHRADSEALNAAIQRQAAVRKAEQADAWRDSAAKAQKRWQAAQPALANHPYLIRKGIAACTIRQEGDALLVPMFDPGGLIWNLQRIQPDGSKRFMPGCRTKGLFWRDGTPGRSICIGEGFATMAAVRQATGHSVVAAMSASNLPAVADAIRALFPARDLVICADNDATREPNIGLEAGRKAARLARARLALPIGDICHG